MVVKTLSLDTINANSLQSLQQTLQTMQRLRVGTERVRSGSSIRFVIWYIENGISYKTSLDIWRIEIIFLLLHS